MEYRIANFDDKAQLVALWQEAFGDSEEAISRFFEKVIKPENAVVADDNGNIVSALYLIEAEVVSHSQSFKAYYIYAAATRTEYRQKGVMSALLEYTDEIAVQRKADYLFLRPANERLYSYYRKNGFETAFYEREQEVTADIVPDDCDYVRWGSDTVELDAFLSDSEAFFSEYGYASVDVLRDSITVNYYVSDNPKRLFEEILLKYGKTSCLAFVPAESGDRNAFKTGMIKRINEEAVSVQSAYLGITLE